MAKAWMPGVERIDGGPARTVNGAGAPRAVWTVTGSDPGVWSAAEEARRLLHEGRTTHLVWNPVSGEVVQLLAATRRAGMALGSTAAHHQYLDHGDEGRVCLVVAVVGTEARPFTDGPMTGLPSLLEWSDSWGVPRTWPAGPPGTRSVGAEESVRAWSRGGHFGHDQVPGSVATAPGRVSSGRVLSGAGGATGEQGVSLLSERSAVPRAHQEPQPSVIT